MTTKTKLFLTTLTLLVASTAWGFKVGGLNWPTGDGTANQAMITDGAGSLGWRTFATPTFLSATAPLTYNSSTGVFAIPLATNAANGYLQSSDWINFNNRITGLTSDVSATGPTGSTGPSVVNATVNSVGGSTAANIHAAEVLANAATSANTVSTIVKRDSSGNFSAGTVSVTAENVSGLTASRAVFTDSSKNLTSNAISGTGNVAMTTSPVFTTPDLGTPSALVATNATGTASGLTAGNVTTNANLTGPITSVGNATSVAAQTGTGSTFVMSASPTIAAPTVTGLLAGSSETLSSTLGVTGVATFTAAPVLSSTTASQALFTDASKNVVSNAITGSGSVVMSASPTMTGTIGAANETLSGTLGVTGVATFTAAPILSSTTASQALFTDASKNVVSNAISGSGNVAMTTSPVFTTPNLGTPSTLVATNATGTASGLTAGNVTTNANLTGVITSVGNATSIASQTGTGTKFVVDTSPTIATPTISAPTVTGLLAGSSETLSSTLGVTGDFSVNTNKFNVTASSGNTSVAGTLGVTGVATFTAQPIVSSLSTSQAIFSDSSKGLVSNALTGSGNVVMSASPTLTGTLTAATANFSGNVTSTSTTNQLMNLETTQASNGGVTRLRFVDSGSGTANKNFEEHVNINGSSGQWGVIRSTAVGGTTFTGTDDLSIDQSGVVAVAGNATVGGTLAVTGASTLAGKTGIGAAGGQANLQLTSQTALTGTVSNSASGTTVTGVGTKFKTDLRIGNTITINSETQTVTAIASDTSLTTSTWTGANSGATATRPATANVFFYNNGSIQSGGTILSIDGTNGLPIATGQFIGNAATAGATTAPGSTVNISAYEGAVTGNTSVPLLNFTRASGTEAAQGVLGSGDNIGRIVWRGASSASAYVSTAIIEVLSTQAFSTSQAGSKMQLSTTANGAVATTVALTLDQDQSATFGGAITQTVTGVTNSIAAPSTFTNAAIKMTGITTGTNADTVCLKSDGTLLIQAAACTISSRRFKEDISYLWTAPKEMSALDVIMALNPVEFRMKEDPDHINADINYHRLQVGLIAEDVEKVDARLALYDQDGITPKSYRQEAVIATLVGAVKEQQAEILELKREVKKLRKVR